MEEALFCNACGEKVEAVNGATKDILMEEPKKKSKKKGFTIGIIIVAIVLFGMMFLNEDSKYVECVKNGHPNGYQNITYEDAFNSFFGNPEWKYYKAENGEDIVEFTGKCMYDEQEIEANLQFVVNYDAGTFNLGTLEFNDISQNIFVTAGLLEKVFEEYEE